MNNRDENFTRAKMERRMAQIKESVARYLQQLDTADRQEPSEALKAKTRRLKEKIEKLKEQMQQLEVLKVVKLLPMTKQAKATLEVEDLDAVNHRTRPLRPRSSTVRAPAKAFSHNQDPLRPCANTNFSLQIGH